MQLKFMIMQSPSNDRRAILIQSIEATNGGSRRRLMQAYL